VPTEKEFAGFVSVSIEYRWRISFESTIGGICDNIDPLCLLLGLASSDVNFFLLSFHCGWMIWGVGAGRKLLKCCGNCCDSKRDTGLLFVKDVVGVLRLSEEGAVHLVGGNSMLSVCWVTGIDVGKDGGRGTLTGLGVSFIGTGGLYCSIDEYSRRCDPQGTRGSGGEVTQGISTGGGLG